ncbi:MAG TPA: PAS domain-containing protein, partial [Gallionella sp.]|nr:PAS domain-containing protein [Gallionella sp.]
MMNSASIKKADALIDAVNEMMADEINAARLDEIVASASQMSDAGQYVEACNVLGMVAALRGDSFEVERRFKAAIQRGGNDAWTLGNYATALNHLVGVIQKSKHHEPLPAKQGELERPSQLVGAASGHMNDIAERKYMDEAWITASDRDFRSLVESLPDNVARWDTKGRYVYINPALERTLAPAKVDVIGKTKSEAFPDGRFALVEKTISQVVATGETVRLVRQLVPAENGEMRLHDITLVPEFDVSGKIVSAVCLGRDMTDFYRMQEVIAAREHEFRSLAENLPDNIIRWDCQGRYLYINPTHERLLGIPALEIVGREISDTHESVKAAIAQVVATGQPALCVRQQVIDAQGERVFHEVRLIPERDSVGRIVSVLGMGRDMTDIYRMQDAIAARAQEFRSLAESSPDSIIRHDRKGRILYVNSGLMQYWGLVSADDVSGMLLGEVWTDGRFAELEHA